MAQIQIKTGPAVGILDPTSFNLDQFGSGSEVTGKVPKSDGAGGVAWQDDTGGLDWDEDRTLYIGKHGDDGNDAKNVADAKLTIGSAITAASALTPSSSNPVVIRILDAGIYAEHIALPSWVSLDAPNATIGPGATAAPTIEIGEGCHVRAKRAENNQTNQAVLSAVNTAGDAYAQCEIVIGSTNIECVRKAAAGGRFLARIRRLENAYRGLVSHVSMSSASEFVAIVDEMILTANNAIGVFVAHLGRYRHFLGRVIKASAGLSGTIAVTGGPENLVVRADEIDADTAIDVPFGNSLELIALRIAGTVTGSGTRNILQIGPSGIAQRAIGYWATTPPSSQPSKINDPTGGTTVDTECRTQLAAVIDLLESYGFSSPT